MFCPQCGQQSSDEIRFCPKCGLQLAPHAALLSVGHTPARGAVAAQQSPPVRSAKRVQMRRAAKLMFFSVVLFPLFLGLSIATDGPAGVLLNLLMFLGGLAWMVYAKLFGDDSPHVPRQSSSRDLKAGGEKPALNAQQFVPASLFDRQRANTAEIVQPPSVTEHTTKLLDQDS
jgi:hypothetical protein